VHLVFCDYHIDSTSVFGVAIRLFPQFQSCFQPRMWQWHSRTIKNHAHLSCRNTWIGMYEGSALCQLRSLSSPRPEWWNVALARYPCYVCWQLLWDRFGSSRSRCPGWKRLFRVKRSLLDWGRVVQDAFLTSASLALHGHNFQHSRLRREAVLFQRVGDSVCLQISDQNSHEALGLVR